VLEAEARAAGDKRRHDARNGRAFELCRIIKSTVDHSHIPVILLTAKNTIQAKVEGLELGADAYIEKPFSKEHLLAQISSLLKNRNMVREFFASSPLVHIKSMAHTRSDEKFLETLHDHHHKEHGRRRPGRGKSWQRS